MKFKEDTSVQTLQHIPCFKDTTIEAHRVIRSGGIFANYSLNCPSLIKNIYRILGKHYHINGNIGMLYLWRASEEQKLIIEEVFSNKVTSRFTYLLLHPEFKITFTGNRNVFGTLDSMLSSNNSLLSVIARQQSHHTTKQ